MKKYLASFCNFDYWKSRGHLLVIIACLSLAAVGQMPDSSAGWVLPLPSPLTVARKKKPTKGDLRRRARKRYREAEHAVACQAIAVHQARATCFVPALRSLILAASFLLVDPNWLILTLAPLLLWLIQLLTLRYPFFAHQPEVQVSRAVTRIINQALILALISILGAQAIIYLTDLLSNPQSQALLAGSSVIISRYGCESTVTLETKVDSEGNESYHARLSGEFSLAIPASDGFRRRLLILFLRLLEVPNYERGGRRTRDGRIPFVTGAALAEAYSVQQSKISRWQRYWLENDWRRLLSERAPDVLTLELQDQIVNTFAQFPWWGQQKVHHYLNEQGIKVSHRQVRQAAEESGWSKLCQQLQKRFVISAESFRPRDEWLVSQLLKTNEQLIKQLENVNALPTQLEIQNDELKELAKQNGIQAAPALAALPWMLRVQQILFGQWQLVSDDQACCCTYCGSNQVSRKSRKGRIKKFIDADGQVHEIEVYRYYCRNPQCDKGTFTNLPSNLLPYSPYTTERHLLALQMYGWAGSNYRRCGRALGISSATVYRWVSAFGHDFLSVAALFGAIRCSGVIGIDEKFVKVPKNNKVKSKMSRWMYVYVAVDCYTYDLLHIRIYAHRNEKTARAFLLELLSCGYKPKAVVTDMWQKYNDLIGQIFPAATHQECIFHALKEVQKKIKEIYGPNYTQSSPDAVTLKKQIYHIFSARTGRTAQKRYDEVMALRSQYQEQQAESEAIFVFLSKHWARLIPAIGSTIIPRTNNTAELVIRRFDQHYQNFCGFDSVGSAQQYLAVFEKIYRFTPFSQDAQPRLRGKSPLEIAGYDISNMPMATICAGLNPQCSRKPADLEDREEAQDVQEALAAATGLL